MNYQTEPITMWFDRRLVLRKSPIQGIGTFATHDMADHDLWMLFFHDSEGNTVALMAEVRL